MAARPWHKAPLVRLLIALISGIIIERYGQFSETTLLTGFGLSLLAVLLYAFIPLTLRYRFAHANGVAILLLLLFLGGVLFWFNDIRNNP